MNFFRVVLLLVERIRIDYRMEIFDACLEAIIYMHYA